MNLIFLLSTAVAVSIDSFICGFTVSFKCEKKLPLLFGITLVVFALCLITNYLGVYLSEFLTEKTANLGGIILIAIGVYNLFSKEKTQIETKSILKQSLLLGFGVGLDGAFGNLSLALMGYNSFFVPVTIALTHLLLIGMGVFLSERHFLKIFKKLDFIPSLILILLGLYKLIFFFF